MKSADDGAYVDPTKTTLSEFLTRWETWVSTQVSGKTLERYKELATHHVRPHIGASRMQKLQTVHFAELYGKLQKAKANGGSGLAPRTVGHVHRLLHQVFGHAVKWQVITINPVALADPPRVERTEVEILSPDQIKKLLTELRTQTLYPDLYPVAVMGISTGMRRGEMLALRWGDVDLDGGKLRVERSIEQTNAGISFKAPKTKAGRRTVTIPPSIVAELRKHWTEQQKRRLILGLGKAGVDDLVLSRADASTWPPDSLTMEWARAIHVLKLPKVTLHALRHTHVSQLIAAGMDVVTVSHRIGHSNPTVTLGVYSHLFGNTDERAAAVVEAALGSVLA